MNALERMFTEFEQQATQRHAPTRSAARIAAAQALREAGLPTRRDENWHYANLRAFDTVGQFAAATLPEKALPALPEAMPGFTRLLFVDGRRHGDEPQASYSGIAQLPFESAAATEAEPAFAGSGDGRLGLTARLFAPEPLALRLSGQASVEIISVSSAPLAACQTDIVIEVAAGAQVSLIERRLTAPTSHAGVDGATAIDGHNMRVRIEAGASLTHTRLQQTGDHVVQHDTLAVTVRESASYRLRQVTAGGASARSSVQVRLAGHDAIFDLRAVAAGRGSQVADAQYTVLHDAPGTRSDQLCRGIASDRAHVACSADVLVAATATGARVQQSLRGLIDGKGAEVDLRPRLTINTNEVQATHGATTGRLDENLLFYLLARGIDEPAARSLLKWAFLGEALGAIEPKALRREAGLAAAARLSDTPAQELLQ